MDYQIYKVRDPSGNIREIKGPTGASDDEVISRAKQLFTPAAPPTEQGGFFSSLKQGASTLGELPAALRFGTASPEEAAARREALVKANEPTAATTSFADIKDVGSAIDWAKQTAGGSLGSVVAPAAGSLGALLMKGPGAAKAVGAGLLGAQYLTENLGRQAGEQTEAIKENKEYTPTSLTKAGVGAAGQTALDVVGFKFLSPVLKAYPIVGRLFGEAGEKASVATADQLVDAFKKGTITYTNGVAKGIGLGVVVEVPQEIAQQALERWQAGLSLTDANARKEYLEAAAGAVLLGGGIGGMGAALDTRAKKVEAANIIEAQEEVKKREAESAKAAAAPAVKEPAAPLTKESAAAPAAGELLQDFVGGDLEAAPAGAKPIDEFAADDVAGGLGGAPPDEKEKIMDSLANTGSTEETARLLGVSRAMVKKVQQDNNIPSKATPEGRAAFPTWSAQRKARIAADAAAKVAKAQQTAANKAAEEAKLKAEADAKAVEDARLKTEADAVTPALYQASYENLPNAENATYTFKTAKGSVYEHRADGTTVRDKQQRPEHPDEKEKGLQPVSTKTLYVDSKEVNKLAKPSLNKAYLAPVSNTSNTVAWHYGEGYGGPNNDIRKKGEVIAGTEVSFTLTPQIGLNPIEVFENKSGQNVHYGNPITEVQEVKRAATTGKAGTGTGAKGAGASIQTGTPAGAATDAASGVGVGGAGTAAGESDVGKEDKQLTLITEERQKARDKAKKAVAKQKPLDIAEEEKLANEAMDKIKAASFDAKALGLTEEEATREGKKVFAALKGTASDKIKEKQIEDAAEIIFSIPNKLKNTPEQQNKKKNALKYLVDVRDGITSESEVVEKKKVKKELQALIETKTVSFKEIEDARDDLLKISERFDKRTLNAAADDLQLHKGHLRNQYVLEGKLYALTYKQDVDYTDNKEVKAVIEKLKEAKAITQAHLKEIQKKVSKKVKPAKPEVRVLSEEETKAQEAKQKQEQEDKDAAEEARKEADIAADIELKKDLREKSKGKRKAKLEKSEEEQQKDIAGEEVEGLEDDTVVDPDTLLRSQTRKERGEVGMQVDEVQKVVDLMKSRWKDAPVIKVVQRIVDLPAETAMRLMNHGWEDTPGLFVPSDNGGGMVYLIADNLIDQKRVVYTTIHEVIGHYGLRKILGDKYLGTMNSAYFNSTIKKAANRIRAENNTLSKEESVEEALAQLSEEEYNQPLIRGIIDRIVVAIRAYVRKIFGEDVFKGMSDVELRRLIRASNTLLETGEGAGVGKVEGRAVMMSPPRKLKQAEPTVSKPTSAYMAELGKKMDEKFDKPKGVVAATKFLMTDSGLDWLVHKFQNDRVVVKKLEDGLRMAGKLIVGEKGFNNLYSLITNSSGNAFHLVTQYVQSHVEDAQNAIYAYAKTNNIDVKEALNKLHLYLMAQHEPERRRVKYLRNAPLSNAPVRVKGQTRAIGAADLREMIYKELDKNENLSEIDKTTGKSLAEGYRTTVEYLVKNFVDPNGYTPSPNVDVKGVKKPKPDNLNSDEYRVIGEYPQEDIVRMRKEFEAELKSSENGPSLRKLMAAMKDLNENTIELDRQANYWTQPVDNYKSFYGYEHYVPFKGRPQVSDNDDKFEYNSKGRSGELVQSVTGFEGRESDSDNPILQTFADAATSAMRAGRLGVTESIKNLMGFDEEGKRTKPQYIKGDRVAIVEFKDRENALKENPALKSPNNIFHYMPDGTIEVYSIKDNAMLEGIRRSFKTSQPFIQFINQWTSFVGKGHTRFNPSFAPMNFVRDALTNAFTIGAEMGPKAAYQFISTISDMVARGGMKKAWIVASLYEKGGKDNIAKIQKMGESDPFIRDILEYLETGGRVSYVQGLAVKSQMDELLKDVGRSKLIRSTEQVTKYIDIWTNMFELTSRAAAYSVAKSNAEARNMTKAAAKIEATAYAKNLANFEQVGEWGRAAGAAFMFFRPAATGAVRALDALMPWFQDTETALNRQPPAIKDDPKAAAEFRKNHKEHKKNARYMAMGLAGAGATIYLMALMMAGDDELGRNKVATDDMSRWTRYLRLPIPGSDQFFQIPWGFGLGAFAAAGAQVAGAAFGKTSLADMGGNLAQIALDSYVPLPISRMSPTDNFAAWAIDSIMPSLIRPFVEYVMNVDSLGREIYNNRQTRFGDAYTGGDNIPEIYKSATRNLANFTSLSSVVPNIDWSANTMYFFLNNYVDGQSRIAQNGFNLGLFVAGDKQFDAKHDLMLVDSFIGKKSNFDAREFAAVENQIKDKEKRLKMFAADPEQYAKYIEAYPLDLAIVDTYNKQVNGTLNKVRAQLNVIRRSPDYSPKERKELIEDLTSVQNLIKRGMIDTFEAYDIKP